MSSIKGTQWFALTEYLQQKYGEASIGKVIRTMNEEDQAVFSKPVLPISWLDFGVYMRFVTAADRLLGHGDMQVFRDLAVFNARKDFKGIYRLFISITSPKILVSSAAVLWRQLFDHGEVKVTWHDDHSGAMTITNFPDMPLNHEFGNGTYIEEALRLSGAKNARVTHPQCLARGDQACVFEARWD